MQTRSQSFGNFGKRDRSRFWALICIAAYAPPGFPAWGGQQYFAVPAPSATPVRTQWVYIINGGKSVRDGRGNVFRFGKFRVVFKRIQKDEGLVIRRTSCVPIRVSGSNTGSITIRDSSLYEESPEGGYQLRRTTETITEKLSKNGQGGTTIKTVSFRYVLPSGSLAVVPPSYDGTLNPGESHREPVKPQDGRTHGRVSGNLHLFSSSSDHTYPLTTPNIRFTNPPGWEVTDLIPSMAVKAGVYADVAQVGQIEPNITVQYSDGSGGRLVVPKPKAVPTFTATSWVARGIGVIKYEGPFHVGKRPITYELESINGRRTVCN